MTDADRITLLEEKIQHLARELESESIRALSQKELNDNLLDTNDRLIKRIDALEAEIEELKRQIAHRTVHFEHLRAEVSQLQSELAGPKDHSGAAPDGR